MSSAVLGAEVVRYRVAGFWRRLAAAAIDGLVLLPVVALVSLALGALLGGRIPRLREIGVDYVIEILLGRNPLVVGGFVLCMLVVGLYFVLFHASRGQTIGKQIVGLRVITKTGERPALLRAVGRTAGYFLSGLVFSLGFIWIGFDREKRGLHDWLAGTYVVFA